MDAIHLDQVQRALKASGVRYGLLDPVSYYPLVHAG